MNTLTQTISLPKPLLKKGGVVVLSLTEFENFKENLEILASKNLAKEIAKARQEFIDGKIYTLEELKKSLRI